MDHLTSILLVFFFVFGNYRVTASSPNTRCPLTCICNGSLVSCIYSYLTDIPTFPRVTQKIIIKGNNISRLRADAFSELMNLKILLIHENNIRTIDERAFSGLSSLYRLDIMEELLTTFEKGTFRFLSNLVQLNMRANTEVEPPQIDICLLHNLRMLKLFTFSSARFHSCFEKLSQLRVLTLEDINYSNISRATFHPFRASVKQLRVSQCELRHLSADVFSDLSQLITLDLTQNEITTLPQGIFVTLTNLVQLVLARNKFKVMSDKLLLPLSRLVNLDIAYNKHLTITLGPEFEHLTQLNELSLSGMNLTSLGNDTFRHLRHSALIHLFLKQCSLHYISRGAFRPLGNLTVLLLEGNPLNSFALREALLGLRGAPIRLLTLSNLNLGELSATLFDGLRDTGVKQVMLQNSYIASVRNGAFRNLQNLTSLDLSINEITLLEDRVFEDLANLEYLNLENNNIVELPSAKRVGLSPGLSALNMERNYIKRIKPESLIGYTNLTKLFLRHNNIYKISPNAFKPLSMLTVLDLSENEITSFKPGAFDPLTRLEILLLARNNIVFDNASLFQPLNRLKELDLSQNAFIGRRPDKLRSILQNLTSLEYIRLNECQIGALPVGMFFNTTQVRKVGLSGNAITSWNPDVFAPLRQMRLLTLARNKIVHLNVASFSRLTSLSELALSNNPFACNCDLMWFIDYVQDNNIFVIDIGRPSSYTCASPASVQGMPILRVQLTPEDCISRTDLYITLASAGAVAVTAIIFSLAYRGRWYIRYYFYLMRSRRRRYRELADGSSYVYDAFVAHNSDDRVWVVRSLLPQLESEGRYRLCLHQRDWMAGREISENIVESIERSRKVIVILSNSFAQSRWCQIELAMANNRCLGNRRKSLILVLLETISPENQTAVMRCLLTTQTYLEWNEREEERFWKALKKALRPPHGTTAVPMEFFQQHRP